MIATTPILCLALALAGDPTLDTADEYMHDVARIHMLQRGWQD